MKRREKPRRRWIRWVVGTPVAVLITVALWGVMDADGGVSGEAVWTRRWETSDGAPSGGYLIRPDMAHRLLGTSPTRERVEPSDDGRRPAVLLIHEWWGLNRDIATLAEMLAADGYIVLAPDAFRGRTSVSIPGALVQIATTPQEQIGNDLKRALDELKGLPEVDPSRVAVAGFCFGGTQAMRLGTRVPEIAATAIFYGGGPITEAETIGTLGADGPVLGIYGADDRTIPVEDVRVFQTLLEEAEVDTRFTIYEGVGHAFVSPEAIRSGGIPREAWNTFRSFLADALAR